MDLVLNSQQKEKQMSNEKCQCCNGEKQVHFTYGNVIDSYPCGCNLGLSAEDTKGHNEYQWAIIEDALTKKEGK